MSLDVYLTLPGERNRREGTGIFIRENGETREIARTEWDQRFPGCEPVMLPDTGETDEVYSANITHNLGRMANEAGIYEALWRPDEHGMVKAAHLIGPLREGLEKLRARPEHFKQFNPTNNWGDYRGLVAFTSGYLAACEEYPDADVRVSR